MMTQNWYWQLLEASYDRESHYTRSSICYLTCIHLFLCVMSIYICRGKRQSLAGLKSVSFEVCPLILTTTEVRSYLQGTTKRAHNISYSSDRVICFKKKQVPHTMSLILMPIYMYILKFSRKVQIPAQEIWNYKTTRQIKMILIDKFELKNSGCLKSISHM